MILWNETGLMKKLSFAEENAAEESDLGSPLLPGKNGDVSSEAGRHRMPGFQPAVRT